MYFSNDKNIDTFSGFVDTSTTTTYSYEGNESFSYAARCLQTSD